MKTLFQGIYVMALILFLCSCTNKKPEYTVVLEPKHEMCAMKIESVVEIYRCKDGEVK